MAIDKGKSKVDESSNFDSVHGREKSSSPFQASSSRRRPRIDHSNMELMCGSHIMPTDLGAVRVYLKEMVKNNNSNSITTLNVYGADPWLLDHVHNDLFRRNEWYYFSQRNKRGHKTIDRTVPRSDENEGGTWKSTDGKKPINNKKNKVKGYKQNFVYYKTMKGEIKKTDWLMTEYCLYEETQDEFVLCHIRGKIDKKVKDRFVKQMPQVKNNILSNQVQDEGTGLTGGVNSIDMRMLHRDHGDATRQQQQQQEQDISTFVLPPLEGQDSGFETQNNNDINYMTTLNRDHGDVTHQQQQEHDAPILVRPAREGQYSGFETQNNNDSNYMTMPYQDQYQSGDLVTNFHCPRDHGDVTHQQQQEQDAPILALPPHDLGFDMDQDGYSELEDFDIDVEFPGADDFTFDISDVINVEGDIIQPDFLGPPIQDEDAGAAPRAGSLIIS